MDKYVCLKKSDVFIPTEGEEESSSDEDDGDEDGDDDEDDEDEEEGGEGSDADGPDTVKQELVEVEEEVEVGGDVSHLSSTSQCGELISDAGSTCQSHTVLRCVKGHHSISRGCDQYTTSWRDIGNVLC